jgi:hypothetical protein
MEREDSKKQKKEFSEFPNVLMKRPPKIRISSHSMERIKYGLLN